MRRCCGSSPSAPIVCARQNSWKNMSEIKFLQSGPGLDIATHAPCAIDSGFGSVARLHHLCVLGCTLARKPLGDCESSQTPRADAARVSRFGAGIDRLAMGTREKAAVQTGPVPLSSISVVLVGESRRESRRISSTSDTDKPATPPMQPCRPGRLVRENGG